MEEAVLEEAARDMGENAARTLDGIYRDVLCNREVLFDLNAQMWRQQQIFNAINVMPAPPVRCLGVIADCPGCGAPTQVGTCRYCGRIMV